ncbi:MAG: hypothetical protein ABSF74_02275 [Dehalococcoidia bacterium]|jgi:hypothetical protein
MAIAGNKYPFSQENVDKTPESMGIYELFDGDTIIYIGLAPGQGDTIRKRLQAHKRGDQGSGTKNATHYKREICNHPIARQKEEQAEFMKANGKLPRCNESERIR